MRIAKNKILENQYTSGNEFVEKVSYKPYTGYYYNMGDQFYSGKQFNINAIEIIKINPSTQKVDNLSLESLKYFFKSSDSTKNLMSSVSVIKGIYFTPTAKDIENGYSTRYFVKKNNNEPILITEVNKDSYENIKNPIYTKISLIWRINGGFNQNEIDELDKTGMKGIKSFLSV